MEKLLKVIASYCEDEGAFYLTVEGVGEGGFFSGDHAIQEIADFGLEKEPYNEYKELMKENNAYKGKGSYDGYYFRYEEDANKAAEILNEKYGSLLTVERVRETCDDYGAEFELEGA